MRRYEKVVDGIRQKARTDAERGVRENRYGREDYRASYDHAYDHWANLTPEQRATRRRLVAGLDY